MLKLLLPALALTACLSTPSHAQTAPVIPKGSWGLLTATQPTPQLWGVFSTATACAAGQNQIDMTMKNKLAAMRGVTPDEFTDAVNKLHALEAANCVQG